MDGWHEAATIVQQRSVAGALSSVSVFEKTSLREAGGPMATAALQWRTAAANAMFSFRGRYPELPSWAFREHASPLSCGSVPLARTWITCSNYGLGVQK